MSGTAPRRVVVAGDWHGQTGCALDIIRRVPELLSGEPARIIVQLGDFGVWPGHGGGEYLRRLDRALKHVDAAVCFIDGNHEHHPRLEQLPRVAGMGQLTDRIWHLPRGHRWVWHGRTWLALGGAVSLDRVGRTEGRDWWPQETITPGQAHHAIHDGPAEVMITHDCPASVRHSFPPPPTWWAVEDLQRNQEHRELLQSVVDAVRPEYLMHGHLHMAYDREIAMEHGPVRVTGLAADGDRGNAAVLDVETMEWETLL